MSWCVLKPSNSVDGMNTDGRCRFAQNLKQLRPVDGWNALQDASAQRLGHADGTQYYDFGTESLIVVEFCGCAITETDFIRALEYVLTSTDLAQDDPRPSFAKNLADEMALGYQLDD